MNANALLKAQGWRGEGRTLHHSNDSVGLKKRIAFTRNNIDGPRGIGSTQHTQEQWWLSALSEQLAGLQSTPDGRVVQKLTDGKLNKLGEHATKSELYKLFVHGGTLNGTMEKPSEEEAGVKLVIPVNHGAIDDIWKRRDPARVKIEDTRATASSSEAVVLKTETKEERKARRAAKRKRKEERRLRREARATQGQSTTTTPSDTNDSSRAEDSRKDTKEEKRARKEARQKRREEKAKAKS